MSPRLHEQVDGRGVDRHPDLADLRRFVLWTRDAHGLYEQYGFERLGAQPGLMGVIKPFGYGGNES